MGLQSLGTKAWGSREGKEELSQVCVENQSLLVYL